MTENEKHPYDEASEMAITLAAANLSNLKYYALMHKNIIVTDEEHYNKDKYAAISQSLKILGLKRTTSRELENGDDYSLSKIPVDKEDGKYAEYIIELILSRSAARKLAENGVKSEVLQALLPIEEHKKNTHADKVTASKFIISR